MKKEDKKVTKDLKVSECRIIRAHEFKDGNVAFDMVLNGITLYGLSLVWYKKEKRYFVSFPAKKADDRYFNHYWFPVSDDLLETIRADIEQLLGE